MPSTCSWIARAAVTLLLGGMSAGCMGPDGGPTTPARSHPVGPSAGVSATTTTVYPTNTFPLDVENVQAAINRGGTVLLKATNEAGQPTDFNFGTPDPNVPRQGVYLTTDVSISGERVGSHMTTIRGGSMTIFGGVPVKSAIRGIDFEGSQDTPIALIASTGATIEGNIIRGLVPLPRTIYWQGETFYTTEVEGVEVGNDVLLEYSINITGHVTVANNVIEMAAGIFANGINFDDAAADIDVTGNTITFLQSPGPDQAFGILLYRVHNRANVSKNRITMGPGPADFYNVAGILACGYAEGRYVISSNTIVNEDPNASGIVLCGYLQPDPGPTDGAVVVGNHITIPHGSAADGINFSGEVRNSHVLANTIEGTAESAVALWGNEYMGGAESNIFAGNDISGLTTSIADVIFYTYSENNLFAGHCSSYLDLGTGNRILCGGPVASAAHAGATASARARGVAARPRAIHRAY